MSRTTRVALWLCVSALVLATVVFVVWRHLRPKMEQVRLPPRSAQAVPRTMQAATVMYRQRDARWAEDPIGPTRETLGSVGCTVCCLAMALAEYGIDITPKDLNRRLTETGGFTEQGLVKWDAVRSLSGGKVNVAVLSDPANGDIDDALAAGNPVLVKVLLGSMFQHWVLLVGRDGREYLMKDPLAENPTVLPLSTLKSDIFAVRVVRRVR